MAAEVTAKSLFENFLSLHAGEVAIAWTLGHPAVTGAIVGARSAKQVEGVMRAGDFRLTEEEIAVIERSIDERTPHGRSQRHARSTSSG
jgi:aryl-alcohol dehydrogenase-like predicted oxidoreductase